VTRRAATGQPADAAALAADWYRRRTFAWPDWPVERLLARKGTTRISVVIPAKNEAATVGGIVAGIRADLMAAAPLVDELIVIDSDSDDGTAERAAEAGAVVHAARAIRPELTAYRGKGEALWKSQFVATGDLLVFIDADLTGWGTHFVRGLVGPLLTEPGILLVKGFYDRVLDYGTGGVAAEGGRVTELVARPLLNLYWPMLARVVQPLAGEWAIRRSTFGQLSVPVGYGVELATLLDVQAGYGLDAVAQVDLGERAHSHQSVHDLGVMAAEIITTAQRRRTSVPEVPAERLWQFDRTTGWRDRLVPVIERPPARPAH
jgi:glucosyl-3-phosphoglycerate synthase